MYVNTLRRVQPYRQSARPNRKITVHYQDLRDGLYLIKRESELKGVDHYGILDVGNRLNHPQADWSHPLVFHQTPPSISVTWLTGRWTLIGKIRDEYAEAKRLQNALNNPIYDLFGNNCEHFVHYVATGNKESKQLQSVSLVVGLAAITIMAWRVR